MPNRKKTKLTPEQELLHFYKAYINHPTANNYSPNNDHELQLLPLSQRISSLLNIFKKPNNKYQFMYLIMYDIEVNKIRTQIAKYLIRSGAIRIQKSVYLISTDNARIQTIRSNLKYIQGIYDNEDSIIIMPVSKDILTKAEFIGKEIYLNHLSDPDSTLIL